MIIYYSPRCLEYEQPGHPESPARVQATHASLTDKGYQFSEPSPCTDEDILLAHSPDLLQSVKNESFFDFDTPVFKGIYHHAILAAGSAVDAATTCLEKREKTFSLMRPPGHHATRSALGGFCYFNNIAVASLKGASMGHKVGILDFDCHHGNGTEDIVLGNESIIYVSLHQSPLYPGTGLKSRENCINYPLSSRTTPEEYLVALDEGLAQIRSFGADLLAISAGFDTYALDPITNLTLQQETYREIGQRLSSMDKPLFAVLEGGYSRDLPSCIYQFLTGLEE